MSFLIIFSTLLILIFMTDFFMFSKEMFQNSPNEISKEKLSAFECGFNSFLLTRSPFSMHFFLILLIFLIFDMEIVFLLPVPLSFSFSNLSSFSFSFVLIIIFYGLFHEWWFGSLKWTM